MSCDDIVKALRGRQRWISVPEALKDAASRGKRIDRTRKDENREGLHN